MYANSLILYVLVICIAITSLIGELICIAITVVCYVIYISKSNNVLSLLTSL